MALLGAHRRREQIECVPSVVALDLDSIWLSALPLSEGRSSSDPSILELALEARDQLLDAGTFIAIRWGSVVDSVEMARKRVESRIEHWKAILESRDGLVEMTFKIGGRGKPMRPDHRSASSGAAYLHELREMRQNVRIDEVLLEEAIAAFEPHAVDLRQRRREDGGAEIAILVSRGNTQKIAAAGLGLRESRPDSAFLLSGPWPLERFAE